MYISYFDIHIYIYMYILHVYYILPISHTMYIINTYYIYIYTYLDLYHIYIYIYCIIMMYIYIYISYYIYLLSYHDVRVTFLNSLENLGISEAVRTSSTQKSSWPFPYDPCMVNHRKAIGKPYENHGKTMGKCRFSPLVI